MTRNPGCSGLPACRMAPIASVACSSGTAIASTRPRLSVRLSPGRLGAPGWATTTPSPNAIAPSRPLYVAKVGQVRVRWSRELPSAPSSVTVIREPDGRYYASFVVDREPSLLPPVSRTAGIDLGLVSFATIATGDGTVETIANPRHLRAAERGRAIA